MPARAAHKHTLLRMTPPCSAKSTVPTPYNAIRFAKNISYYVYNGSLPRPTWHHIRTARRLYRLAPYSAPLGTRPLSANLLARCLCDASVRALNLTASRTANSKSWATKRSIKFYAERSKSARTSSRKSRFGGEILRAAL